MVTFFYFQILFIYFPYLINIKNNFKIKFNNHSSLVQLSNNDFEPTINVYISKSVDLSLVLTRLSSPSSSNITFTLSVESVNIVFGY